MLGILNISNLGTRWMGGPVNVEPLQIWKIWKSGDSGVLCGINLTCLLFIHPKEVLSQQQRHFIMSSLFCISIKDIFYTFHKLPIDRYRVDFHFYDISSFLSQSKKAFLHGRLLKQWHWKYHQPSTLTIISWKPRGWSQRCCCWWWLWW